MDNKTEKKSSYQKLKQENERLKDYLYATILETRQGNIIEARAWYFYILQCIKEDKQPYETNQKKN